jgi:glycosyltransferase involved in cell wall biosynthesis
MSAMPRVTVVIPTFNRLAMLLEAVRSALAQGYGSMEVLVSDNASEDGTREAMAAFAADPRFRYIRNPTNLGMVGNWRSAVFEHARGEFFVLLSDDDLLLDPGYLAKAMALVDRNPGLVMVYADGYILDEASGRRTELRLPFPEVERGTTIFAARDRVLPQDFTLCNVLFRRSLAIELSAFDNPFNICCDSELFLKACLLGDVGVIHDFVSQYRIHGNNLILRHHPDLRIYAGSLDHYFTPRRMALARGALSWWQRRAFNQVARSAVRRSILQVAERHPGRVREYLRLLLAADRWLTIQVLCLPRFYRRLALLALRRGLRRWLGRGGPKRAGDGAPRT